MDMDAPRGVMPSYPKRPPFFANRYCRLLAKTCAAQEIGANAFVLCVTIAMLEDVKRYTGPVTFYNGQLLPIVGLSKWESLERARDRALAAGWLQYVPGNRGKRLPGRYWVMIPIGFDTLEYSPFDERQYPANGDGFGDRDGVRVGVGDGDGDGEREGDRVGEREGEHSTLSLNLNPNPKRAPGAGGTLDEKLVELIDGWNQLGPSIVASGNGARKDPPAKAVLSGWKRARKEPEQSAASGRCPVPSWRDPRRRLLPPSRVVYAAVAVLQEQERRVQSSPVDVRGSQPDRK